MSTLVVDPRPELNANNVNSGRSILASSFEKAWQTIGNSYEQLTTGPAPNNGARTVALPHNHTAGKSGAGAIAAQAPTRWQGLSQFGARGSTFSFPFSLSYCYAWAGILQIYSGQECAIAIFGTSERLSPESIPGRVTLEINGLSTPFGFEVSNNPDVWFIAAGLGVLGAGTYHLALKVNSVSNVVSERWSVIGAEVWPSVNNQMVLPP
tara:strand:- start:1883 stop:2509 length:627 start_codon:yes stop_codon:yes gene_type:complete